MLGEDSYMGTNMMVLEPKGIDPEYRYTFINKTGLYKIADTSTIPQINNKHIEPYLLLIPSLEEQHKIGSFFKQLDRVLHHAYFSLNAPSKMPPQKRFSKTSITPLKIWYSLSKILFWTGSARHVIDKR